MWLAKPVSVILLLFFSLSAFSITLNVPQEENEKDIKYKDWVIDNKTIPPVSKRNPDPTKGPRIPVKEIKIQGVKTYPDLSISKVDLDKIVEKKRYDMMDEEFLQKSGYTIQELLELAEVLNNIDQTSSDGNYTDLPEIQKLIWLLKEQKKNRGLTLGEIEEIAETITTYYRQHGFFLAKAFLPSQDVHDGVVGLTVLEGVLGKVTVAGNDLYKSDMIVGLFDDLKNKAVLYENIEQKLYLLNDYPGLKVTGYFRPGDQIGDTHLNLNILNEDNMSNLLRVDNHGSEFTGQNRLYYQFQYNTPAGFGDKLSLGLMRTSSPDNSTYGSITYRAPIFNERNYLKAAYSRNQYILDSGETTSSIADIDGATTVSSLSYENIIKRTRKRSSFFKFEFADSQSKVDSDKQLFRKDDNVNSYTFSYNYDLLSDKGKSVNNGKISISSGEYDQLGISEEQNIHHSFEKLNFSHHYLKLTNIPFSNVPVRIITKFNLQYTDIRLPSIEQMATGGPESNRAYPVVLFSADSGAYLGLEAHFNYPKALDFKLGANLKFSKIASPYLFVDFAYGEQVSETSSGKDNETVDLRGYGFGLEFKYKDSYSGHLLIARPDQYHITNDAIEYEENDILIIDLQYNF